MQALILGQSDDGVDSCSLAPTQHLPTTKAAVGTHRNLDLRPALPQRLDQQRQNRPSMFGRIDVALAQVTHQQPFAAKDVQRAKSKSRSNNRESVDPLAGRAPDRRCNPNPTSVQKELIRNCPRIDRTRFGASAKLPFAQHDSLSGTALSN